MKETFLDVREPLPFDSRRMAPRVCIVDSKPHIRTFLVEAFEDLGFLVHQCGLLGDVTAALKSMAIDLVVLGLLTPESEVTNVLRSLAMRRYTGRVMLFGGRASGALLALHDLGERLSLSMLPPLRTPFRDSDLQDNLSVFLPIPSPPNMVIDTEEAIRHRWLELWYQPRIDLQRMSLRAAEALVRMRHPAWGVVAPESYVASATDPRFRGLADFVVDRAVADWIYFAGTQPPIEMIVSLPVSALDDSGFVDQLGLQLPDHAAFAQLTVQISSTDVSRDPALARKAAKLLDNYNVAVAIDDVMADVSWADLGDFPIAELLVDQGVIRGCAHDRHKRTACSMILSYAERLGARTTAKGLDATADFKAVCEMGFDLGQGALFAKPMNAQKFARTMLRAQPIAPK